MNSTHSYLTPSAYKFGHRQFRHKEYVHTFPKLNLPSPKERTFFNVKQSIVPVAPNATTFALIFSLEANYM